eukprot:1146868-Pelagomonas_calceolata.AAC.1
MMNAHSKIKKPKELVAKCAASGQVIQHKSATPAFVAGGRVRRLGIFSSLTPPAKKVVALMFAKQCVISSWNDAEQVFLCPLASSLLFFAKNLECSVKVYLRQRWLRGQRAVLHREQSDT